MIQDIIFFIIITIVSILYIITILDDNIRFYMFAAIIIGIALSRKIISKYLIKFYSIVFYGIKNFILFLCVPLELNYYIICNIMKKISKKCCKMFSFMITLKCKLLSNLKSNNFKKRGHIVAIVFLAYFGYTFFNQQIKLDKYNSQIDMYQKEIDAKKNLIEYYNNQNDNINSDEYIESVARDKLGLVKPYEKVYVDANK